MYNLHARGRLHRMKNYLNGPNDIHWRIAQIQGVGVLVMMGGSVMLLTRSPMYGVQFMMNPELLKGVLAVTAVNFMSLGVAEAYYTGVNG